MDQGGTINLGAHGEVNIYIGNIYTMPASIIIYGVKITKSNAHDFMNPQGVKVAEMAIITLNFSSDSGDMNLGGQKLYLDNFCFN